jgi:NosR/NirI family transcriptional regulator, nitrous oxide reductase regulator
VPLSKRWMIVLILCGAGTAAAVAQRIITNPQPDAELKQLFPAAAAFSPLSGNPLHFTAYGADPRTNPSAPPIGIAFWTTDMVPQEHGYHGPIHILVGLDLKAIITGVVVDYHSEPYGYFSVEPPKFAAQFKGKSIHDPFVVGRDVDAVSRASISIGSATRAIRDGSRMAAKLLPEAPK